MDNGSFCTSFLLGAEARVPDLTPLSPLDRLLLREIIFHNWVNQPLVASHVITSNLASRVTLQASIKRLIAAKLIGTKLDPDDGRLRYLVPTNKSQKLLTKLDLELKNIIEWVIQPLDTVAKPITMKR